MLRHLVPIMHASDSSTTAPTLDWRIPFDNTYARLPERFYARLDPTPVAAPRLVRLNTALAEQLGLDPGALQSPEGVAMLAGNRVPDGAEPIALAYAGHQFGNFVPQLGDGRANLLGEVVGRDGKRRDLQLKGSGPTPFSRRGDGRAALGPVLREYLLSEAMAALGVPTTRALAAVLSGEPVARETMLPGAVLTRVAASHIRVGTFQYFAAREDREAVRILADYAIARHYPDAADTANPYRALLDGVVARQADLVARWLLIGFIHGVMNTDNSAVSGETIDYGPCAFIEAYDPATVFSSIDHGGRYAYGQQPHIARWNLARLAEALLPLMADGDDEVALKQAVAQVTEVIDAFPAWYERALLQGQRAKLGLLPAAEDSADTSLARDWLALLQQHGVDFTLAWRRLADAAVDDDAALLAMFGEPAGLRPWLQRWRARCAQDDAGHAAAGQARAARMRQASPAVIPRNHRVEAALAAASEHQDLSLMEALLQALQRPYDDDPALAAFAEPAPEQVTAAYQTYCGT